MGGFVILALWREKGRGLEKGRQGGEGGGVRNDEMGGECIYIEREILFFYIYIKALAQLCTGCNFVILSLTKFDETLCDFSVACRAIVCG